MKRKSRNDSSTSVCSLVWPRSNGWQWATAGIVLACMSTVLLVGLSAHEHEFTWTPGNGGWNDPTKWGRPVDSGEYPSQVGDIATIERTNSGNWFITLGADRILTELNIGAVSGDISFSGSTSPRLRFEAPVEQVARINSRVMTGESTVIFRTVEAVSDIIVTASHGRLNFAGAGADTRPSLRGSGDVYFRGAGGVSEISGIGITSTEAYSGNITVDQGGTLRVTAGIAAHPGATFTIGDTGTLNGTSVINRVTTVQSGGVLAPGKSAGILGFGAGLQMDSGSVFQFELFGNSTADRGGLYDGVDITGGVLVIDPGAIFNIVVNGTGSDVDFVDSFWQENRSWLVFSGIMEPDVSGNIFTLGNISLDSQGQDFSVTGGSFSWSQTDNDVYLVYTIPESSTASLVTGLTVLIGALVLRRTRARRVEG